MWTWFYKLASPPSVYGVAVALTPWFLGAAALAMGYGLVDGLVFAPPDYQQGDAFRIVYVHAPSAWLSLFAYTSMAVAGAIGLIWRIKMGHAVAAASAPIGASFTVLALVTGSLWGRPMWGTYWAWDPRLTSELILLFLYAGVMSLRPAFEDPARGDRAAALLAVVGVVNVPIIHYSVTWWNSLHQGPTLAKIGKPSMVPSMWVPLVVMLLGFMLFYGGVLCMRLQGEILNRERQAKWVREAVKS
ncbi:MAG TPA: heme ABC transporter permease [Steroidobacteraceae bacterium]|jgi:heme exporter protein C|nr:heme ABC transporter permease [Steroidobacteraceae bacterium]